ncbi:hypothetical protein OF83DRAFT_65634 [Amylostereum chailletii]|nr:hypothetical protein OF83DRAFT_65634 [Amylostereum chailletii]
MSGGLTEDQAQTVRDQLSNIIRQRVFPNIVETALFAIFTVLICISTCICISKGLRSRPNRILLALTLVMYTASATLWATDLKLMWNELNIFLPELLSPLGSLDALEEMNHNLSFAGNTISLVNFLLGDAVVLWRACVVWNWRKAVVVVAISIFTCLTGFNILYILSDVLPYFPSAPRSLVSVTNHSGLISIVTFSVSAFANVWATSMVALKVWIYRRDIRRYLQNKTSKGALESVLMMLVESGIVYSICMVLLIPPTIPSTSLYSSVFFIYWGDSVLNQISGIYPTSVIVLVALQKMHRDHQFSFLDKGPDATLPFSVRVPQSQTSAFISAPGARPSLQLGTAQGGPYREEATADPLDEALSPQEKEYTNA